MDELLSVVAEVSRSGGGGATLVRRVAALLASDSDERFPACALSGPVSDGRLALLVYGAAMAEVTTNVNTMTLSGVDAVTSVDQLVAGPIERIRLWLPTAGEPDNRTRLDGGVVAGGGVEFAADTSTVDPARGRPPVPAQVTSAATWTRPTPPRGVAVSPFAAPVTAPPPPTAGPGPAVDVSYPAAEVPPDGEAASPPLPMPPVTMMPPTAPAPFRMHEAAVADEIPPDDVSTPWSARAETDVARRPETAVAADGAVDAVVVPEPDAAAGAAVASEGAAAPERAVVPDIHAVPDVAVAPEGVAGPESAAVPDPAVAPAGPIEPFHVIGVFCPKGHFIDPRHPYCPVCGISLAQQTVVAKEGPRPPLGSLVLDDGEAVLLDIDYIIGRDPRQDPDALAGKARPLKIVDAEGVVSRRHARIALVGWDVQIIDLGSSNGTFIQLPGAPERQQLTPHTPIVVRPGTVVTLGRRWLRFEPPRVS